jgi:hypothetical protein
VRARSEESGKREARPRAQSTADAVGSARASRVGVAGGTTRKRGGRSRAYLETDDVLVLQRAKHLDLAEGRLAHHRVVVRLLELREAESAGGGDGGRTGPVSGVRSRTPARRDDIDARARERARGVGPSGRVEARTFFTATTSPVSLFLHLSTTPYAPSPTTPTTSYLFIARDALDSTSPPRAHPPRRHLGRA